MTGRDHVGISEDELHAYVDGRLPGERIATVEAWLAANPEAAAELGRWSAQNEGIRALFGSTPQARPADIALLAPARSPNLQLSRPVALAVACLLVAIGAGLGLGAARLFDGAEARVAMLDSLPYASRTNYLVYASEVRHPVEVRADEEAHLVAWLGKRLGGDLPAPDLTPQGFSLVGGRLVSFSGGPGALLMYEDADGKRVTLLVGRNETNTQTGFMFDVDGAVRTFYWIDGPRGYALSGELDRARLEAVAHEVYEQL